MALTKTKIDQARYIGAGTKKYILWDDEVRNFGLRVFPSGKKSFIVFYRIGAQQRFVTLGQYGVLTLDQARTKARRVLADATEGKDELSNRKTRREQSKHADEEYFRHLAARFLAEHAATKKKERSRKEDERILEKFLLPKLGKRLVKEIDRNDAAKLHHELRDRPIQANRVIALLSTLMTFAERWGLRPEGTNPTRYVDRYKERSRERFLTGDEMTRLGEVLTEVKRDASEPIEAVHAIRLLLLTGCRKSEILTLKWEYLDFPRRRFVLPDSKTGPKVVRLGDPALEYLEKLPRLLDCAYVLPSRSGKGHFVGLPHCWERIREKAGIDDVRLHDLRHNFASVGVEDGLSLPMIGKLLGHRSVATTARYGHLADDPAQHAATRVAGRISTLLNSGSVQELPD